MKKQTVFYIKTSRNDQIKVAASGDYEHILIQFDDRHAPVLDWCQTRLALTSDEVKRFMGILEKTLSLLEKEPAYIRESND